MFHNNTLIFLRHGARSTMADAFCLGHRKIEGPLVSLLRDLSLAWFVYELTDIAHKETQRNHHNAQSLLNDLHSLYSRLDEMCRIAR